MANVCCKYEIIPFLNAAITEVTVGDGLRKLIGGDVPLVETYYFQGNYIGLTPQFERQDSQIELIGSPLSLIRVTHGGESTGYIKIT